MNPLLALAALVAAAAPGAIPDPRPHSQVVDSTGTLQPFDVDAINEVARRGRAGGELVVVVVRSTGGMNPRQWTTAVFNRLGLDEKARNRGVLLMAAIDDRKAEIVVGDGFPDSVTRTTDSIMSGVVVARFKAKDPRGALVQGAHAIVDRVLLQGAASAAGDQGPAGASPVASADSGGAPTPAEVLPPAEVIAAATHPAVQSVPDPLQQDGVVDGARILSKAELVALRAARGEAPGFELAVVTVADTSGLGLATYARGLSHRLRHATGSKHAALLVVLAPSLKKPNAAARSGAELVLDPALPKELTEAWANQVSADWTTAVAEEPRERGRATVAAVAALAGFEAQLAKWQAEQGRLRDEARRARQAEARARSEKAAAELARSRVERKPGLVDRLGLFGMGAIALGFVGTGLGVREAVRRWPRKCKKCQVPMERLGEQADDRFLSEGEKVEERLGSVDYDVWSCPECHEARKLRWGAILSSYSRCTSCSFRTLSTTTRTLQSATQYSTGLAEVTENCAHCGFHNRYTRVIPRRPKPSSRSSSGGGRSSRGSSSGRGSSGSW